MISQFSAKKQLSHSVIYFKLQSRLNLLILSYLPKQIMYNPNIYLMFITHFKIVVASDLHLKWDWSIP